MSNFSRAITSSNWKLIFTVVMLALFALIGVADLFVPNNKMQASGIAQVRVLKVREADHLNKVIKIEEIHNINLPEFPKGFQVKLKNVSNKPIYYILIHVRLPETESLRMGGYLWFELEFGHPKLVQSSLRLEDITESEREEHPLTPLEPGKSLLLEVNDRMAEYVRNAIETEFRSNNPVTKNLLLSIQVINFGDGTGYIIGQPYPNNKKIGLRSPKGLKSTDLNAFNPKGFTAKLLPEDSLFSPKPISFFLRESISFFLPKLTTLPRYQSGCTNLILQPPIGCVNVPTCLVRITDTSPTGAYSTARCVNAPCPGVSCCTNVLDPCACPPRPPMPSPPQNALPPNSGSMMILSAPGDARTALEDKLIHTMLVAMASVCRSIPVVLARATHRIAAIATLRLLTHTMNVEVIDVSKCPAVV